MGRERQREARRGKHTRHVLEAGEKSGESSMRRIDALLTLPEPLPPSKFKPPAFPLHSLAQLLNSNWRRHAHTTQMLHPSHHVTSCIESLDTRQTLSPHQIQQLHQRKRRQTPEANTTRSPLALNPRQPRPSRVASDTAARSPPSPSLRGHHTPQSSSVALPLPSPPLPPRRLRPLLCQHRRRLPRHRQVVDEQPRAAHGLQPVTAHLRPARGAQRGWRRGGGTEATAACVAAATRPRASLPCSPLFTCPTS